MQKQKKNNHTQKKYNYKQIPSINEGTPIPHY